MSYYSKYVMPFADPSTDSNFLFYLTVTLTFGVRTWKLTGLMREGLPIYRTSFEEIRWKNNGKKFGWNITEIADCAFSSNVNLWPWPLTSAPINIYSCSTSYYLSSGQIWERYDEKWQRNRRTQIVGKKNKNNNNNKEKTIQQQKGLPTLSADLNELAMAGYSNHKYQF